MGDDLEGEARTGAARQAAFALQIQRNLPKGARPVAILSGGELTVTHRVFAAIGGQVVTGPSLTNVNDFRAILVPRLTDAAKRARLARRALNVIRTGLAKGDFACVAGLVRGGNTA